MAAKIEDFQAYLDKKQAGTLAAKVVETQIAVDTALHVDHITHDPDWNLYLQKLMVHADRVRGHKAVLLTDIVKPMSPEMREGLIGAYWKCEGFLEALDLAMRLPKSILDNATGST